MVKFKKFQASLVKLNGSVSIDALASEIVQFVEGHIKLMNHDKIDPSLLRYLCNIVENSYNKSNAVDNKVDKKALVIDIYLKLKPHANNNEDKQVLEKLIEDLHTNGDITRVGTLTYIYKYLKKGACTSSH
jgi:hypothetical protein